MSCYKDRTYDVLSTTSIFFLTGERKKIRSNSPFSFRWQGALRWCSGHPAAKENSYHLHRGRFMGSLAVAMNAHGGLEVFARGIDGVLCHISQTNSGWS